MRMNAAWRVGIGLVAAGVGTLGYASLVERNMFTLRRFEVPILPAEMEPLRILHLSDLHLTPGQRRKQRWVASLAGTDPDLVVVTGDHLAHRDAVPAVARALGPLLDLPGAFVFGSNDYGGPVWKNPLGYLRRSTEPRYIEGEPLPTEDLRALLTGAGWADLNNARTTLKAGGRTIELVGVDDPHIGHDHYPSVAGRSPRRRHPRGADPHAEAFGARRHGSRWLLAPAGRAHPRWSGVPARIRRPGHQL